MAIDTTLYSPRDFQFGIAEEAPTNTFGTERYTQTEFQELHVTEVPQIDYGGLIKDETKRSDGKRVMSDTDMFIQKAGSNYTVSVSGILTDLTADLLLYGVMQDLTSEGASADYLKTFDWDDGTDGDDGGAPFNSYTLNCYNPAGATAADRSWSLKGAVLSQLTITGDPGSNGGRTAFSATFFSGYEPTLTGLSVDPTAPWVSPGTDYYVFQDLNTATINGSPVILGSFSFDFVNNAARANPGSDPGTYFFPQFDLTGEVLVKYGPNTYDLVDNFLATTDSPVIVQFGDGSTDGTLKFDVNANYTGNNLDFGGESGVMVNLPFRGVDDGTNKAIQVKIANATSRSW